MSDQNYTTVFYVDQSPEEVFETITNVSSWWSEDVAGQSKKLNDTFTIRFGPAHNSTQKIIEFEPGKKVVWLVTNSYLDWVSEKDEWTDTQMSFEISEEDIEGERKTVVRFVHFGLVPAVECYNGCSMGWKRYLEGSLLDYIKTGRGNPAKTESTKT